MAEILLNLVVRKLCDVVLQEIFFLYEVNGKVEHVKRELIRIQGFLKDADRKSAGDERVKNWVNELRGVSYWIEDTVDLFVMEIDELSRKDPTVQKPNLKEKLKRVFKKPEKLAITHKFGKEIDKILARIDEIAKSRETYGIKNLGESSEVGISVPFKRYIIPELDKTELVGVGDEKEKIVAQLLDGKCLRRSVVSIVGTGGLGKTTVASKAYSSNAVKNEFDIRIWLSISQNFTLIDLLKKILKEIRPLKDFEKDEQEEYFMVKVNKSLENKKYLVVLDDVWSDDLWSQIDCTLPDDKNGSRVLMTSRFFKIPKDADPTNEPHELRFLDENESIELFLKTVFRNRNDEISCHTDLLDIARQLADKCDGLPLALVALGGILSLKPPMYSIWKNVLNTMVWSVDGKKYMNILATSYDDMPLTLKSCFMYLACFPEDYEIDAQELIRLWVAEGFVQEISNKRMEDVAGDCLEELAQRSMIQVLERSLHDYSILTCRIHDLLRDLAIEKAKENNFMTVCANPDGEYDFGSTASRLAVHNFENKEWMKCASSNLRTLLCFNAKLPTNCSEHKLIKVLHFEAITYFPDTNMLNRIKGLSQLRYLHLQGYSMGSRDEECFGKLIGSMRFLQSLGIKFSKPNCPISDCMWHIKTLRHVDIICQEFSLLRNPRSIVLQNMQTLICNLNQSLETTNLPNLPNLRVLRIGILNKLLWKNIVAFLHTSKKLVVLEIAGDDIPIDVLDLEGHHHLTSLSYSSNFSGTFRTTMFPSHLTMLTLRNIGLRQEHISVLEKLPGLKTLGIHTVTGFRISSHIHIDHTIRFSIGGFPHLEYLIFDRHIYLEKWEIEKGAMPMLKKLSVNMCVNLPVPPGLQHLTALRDLIWVKNARVTELGCSTNLSIQDVCKHVPVVAIL